LPADNGSTDSFAQAITEVTESLTRLVHDEIELAKAEVTEKVSLLTRGAIAVAAGAVFGIFAVIFALITIGWAIDDVLVSGVGSIFLGFLIVTVLLLLLTIFAFLFAWKKLKVGAPTPNMAIDEAKKIRATVTTSTGKR
jgi:uncharacterized membrane protein YgcG